MTVTSGNPLTFIHMTIIHNHIFNLTTDRQRQNSPKENCKVNLKIKKYKKKITNNKQLGNSKIKLQCITPFVTY